MQVAGENSEQAFSLRTHRAIAGRTAEVWAQGRVSGAGVSTYQWLAAQVATCQRVLDVGGGSGACASAAYGARDDQAQQAWTTLDHSPEELALCDPRVTATILARAQAMPFAAASFDGVVSHFGITVMPQPQRLAAELARVTCPGGTLALVTGGGPKVGSLVEGALALALPLALPTPRLGDRALRDPSHLRALFAQPHWSDVAVSELVIEIPRAAIAPWLLTQYEFALLPSADQAQLVSTVDDYLASAPEGACATIAATCLTATRQGHVPTQFPI